MKILLVEPNSKFAIRRVLGVSGPPLGLALIASYLREYSKNRHDVKLVDALSMNYTPGQFQNLIRNFNPDVVGISAISTSAIHDVYEYARLVKKVNPDITTFVGGHHVSFTAKESMEECKDIDIIVYGEAEETFLDLMNVMEDSKDLKNVLGIFYRNMGKIIGNPSRPLIDDLDSIPIPAYDQLPMNLYKMGKEKYVAIITSRGCPFGCIFCSSSRLMGKRYRERSAKSIMKEIRLLKNKYGISHIEIIDDMFVLNTKRVKELHDMIKKEGIEVYWSCSSRVDIISRNPDVLKYLKGAGCHTIYVGAESGSNKSLDTINKGITLDQTRKAVRLIKRAGMGVFASFVLGIPGETRKDVEKTIDFAIELDPDWVQFTVCTPYPGTPLYEYAKGNQMLETDDWSKYTVLNPVMKLPTMSQKELKKMLRRAYVRFYFRPKFIWNNIKYGNIELMKKMFSAGMNYVFRK
ncbi:MAG: cobalamin-dependent protein [Candidatus Aenigmatarchaeota archaeon]|nr:MAG: cobalamin-dependent protein [Candidatus Aenigmarchaeota archaeon]